MYAGFMAQLNMNITPEFEAALTEFMRRRSIATKSDAIRIAVEEALAAEGKKAQEEADRQARIAAIYDLLGLGKRWGTGNPDPRIKDHADAWKKDSELGR